MASTFSQLENPDNRQKHSDFYTKRVLRRAVENFDVRHFVRTASHTLAYSLWLANERRGKLVACMVSLSAPGIGAQQVEYEHMVYSDANGQSWDVGGVNAEERYEHARAGEHQRQMKRDKRRHKLATADEESPRPFQRLDIHFDWVEVHPCNVFAFLDEWGTKHPIDQAQTETLTQDILRDSGEVLREGLPGQIDIFGSNEPERDLLKPPYTESWYRKMHRAGWVSFSIPPEHAQIGLFDTAR